MKFAHVTIVFALGAALAGCAQELRVPVTGQTSSGVPAAGEAIARTSGEGEFWVKIPGSTRCKGTYDSLSMSPTLVVDVRCDDGRSGEAVVTRQADFVSGSAIVRLNDGTRAQFVFGDVTFEQAFGDGGTARTR